MAQIRFEHVNKAYDGDKTIIEDLSLSIQEGEIFVLVGPSGSGKTSTLKMINGLSKPSKGTIFYKDKPLEEYDLRKVRWQMGYVLQQIALFPNMTVAQNIMVIPEMVGWSKEAQREEVDRLLTIVGLDPTSYRDRMPHELSGGEQQRIGILRAIAAKPEVILMDEPFSALDPISRNDLQDLVKELHKQLGTTVVFVTHNMDEAVKLGDRIAVMRAGRLLQVDTPTEILNHPSSEFINDFFGETAEVEFSHKTLAELLPLLELQPPGGNDLPEVVAEIELWRVFALLAENETIAVRDRGNLSRSEMFRLLAETGGKQHG